MEGVSKELLEEVNNETEKVVDKNEQKKDKNPKTKRNMIIVSIAVAIVAVIAGYFLYDKIKLNNAIDEVTGVEYEIRDMIARYKGDADRDAAVVQYAEPESGDLIAHIHIKNYGVVTVRFFPEQAPMAVDNFVTHAKEGYYDGAPFHRIIDDFMIQGGSPDGSSSGGNSIWPSVTGAYAAFEDEFSKYLIPIRGALCMANSGASTNGSQFFIVQTSTYHIEHLMTLRQGGAVEDIIDYYRENGGACWLYRAHTVFGQVIEGLDVVDAVAAVETDKNGVPATEVIIEKIELDTY